MPKETAVCKLQAGKIRHIELIHVKGGGFLAAIAQLGVNIHR